MEPRLFPSGGIGVVVNSWAIGSSSACSARTGWQAGAAAQAGSMLPEFLRSPCQTKQSIAFVGHDQH